MSGPTLFTLGNTAISLAGTSIVDKFLNFKI
jgi:hypothetical protein